MIRLPLLALGLCLIVLSPAEARLPDTPTVEAAIDSILEEGDIAGAVVLVQDAEAVEYGQPLFKVKRG